MPLFENLGKKVSSLAQDAVDSSKKLAQVTAAKSKNVAEVSRLKSSIGDEKKSIRRSFARLGKAYYENYRNNDLTELTELCTEIDGHYAELKSLEDRLNQQRGIVVCTECETEIEGECKFCPNCGAQLPEIVIVNETVEENVLDVLDIDEDIEDEVPEAEATEENKEQE